MLKEIILRIYVSLNLLYLNSDRDFDITIMATLLLIEIIQGLYYL